MGGLTPADIGRILGFLGYGNPAAPLWFIGLEKGIGGMGDSDVRHNLKARGQWSLVMDLFQSHQTLVQGVRLTTSRDNAALPQSGPGLPSSPAPMAVPAIETTCRRSRPTCAKNWAGLAVKCS